MVTLFFSHWHVGSCHFHCPGCLHAQKDLNFFLDKKNPPLIPNFHTLWKISSVPSPERIPAHPLIHLLAKQMNKDVAPHPNIVYNTFNHHNYENCYVSFFLSPGYFCINILSPCNSWLLPPGAREIGNCLDAFSCSYGKKQGKTRRKYITENWKQVPFISVADSAVQFTVPI